MSWIVPWSRYGDWLKSGEVGRRGPSDQRPHLHGRDTLAGDLLSCVRSGL